MTSDIEVKSKLGYLTLVKHGLVVMRTLSINFSMSIVVRGNIETLGLVQNITRITNAV